MESLKQENVENTALNQMLDEYSLAAIFWKSVTSIKNYGFSGEINNIVEYVNCLNNKCIDYRREILELKRQLYLLNQREIESDKSD